MLTDDKNDDSVKTFREFAKNNQNEDFIYSISAVTSGFGQRLAEYIGVKEGPAARIISFKNKNLNKYIVSDLSTEGIT